MFVWWYAFVFGGTKAPPYKDSLTLHSALCTLHSALYLLCILHSICSAFCTLHSALFYTSLYISKYFCADVFQEKSVSIILRTSFLRRGVSFQSAIAASVRSFSSAEL